MARLVQGLLALSAALLLLLSWLPISLASSKRPEDDTNSADIPFIKCQVCEKVAHHIYGQVENKKSDIAPNELSEYEMSEIAEKICKLEWILEIDIIKKGKKWELVKQVAKGQCNSDCEKIKHTCQEVIGYSDTEIGHFLFEEKPSNDSFMKYLCNDLSKACPVPIPEVGFQVEVIPEKDPPKMDLTQRILQGIKETPQNIQKLFREVKTCFKSPKASKTEL